MTMTYFFALPSVPEISNSCVGLRRALRLCRVMSDSFTYIRGPLWS